jgi:glycosyltransferase involved in cell wall biosynthesis
MRILIASQDWDYRFARPQHFARIFSEQHQITYLGTGPGIIARTKDALKGRTVLRPPCHQVNPRLHVFNALYWREPSNPAEIRARCMSSASWARRLFRAAFGTADVLILTNPFHYPIADGLAHRQLVYDCLDRYDGFFPDQPELQKFILEQEDALMRRADFMFVSARQLLEDKSRQRKVHYLPHGVEVEFFQSLTEPKPDELKSLRGPIVGFVGGIEHWVDLGWVEAAARKLSDATFILVGDIRVDPTSLPGQPNIRFLGYRPYHQIPRYVAAFDACIIPFRLNYLTAAVNPVKALEYFALGKPVVASHMSELEYYLPHITLVRTADEFIDGIASALRDDAPEARQARIEHARRRSWRRIAEAMLQVITGAADTTGF